MDEWVVGSLGRRRVVSRGMGEVKSSFKHPSFPACHATLKLTLPEPSRDEIPRFVQASMLRWCDGWATTRSSRSAAIANLRSLMYLVGAASVVVVVGGGG